MQLIVLLDKGKPTGGIIYDPENVSYWRASSFEGVPQVGEHISAMPEGPERDGLDGTYEVVAKLSPLREVAESKRGYEFPPKILIRPLEGRNAQVTMTIQIGKELTDYLQLPSFG